MEVLPALIPLLPNRVWRTYPGGRLLDAWQGVSGPRDDHFPEEWIGSTTRARNVGREAEVEEGLARVLIGGRARLLDKLLAHHGAQILGPQHVAAHRTEPGFLFKLLDPAIRLHVQCHPTVSFARERLGADAGKTEGYYILGLRPDPGPEGACVYLGWRTCVDRAAFRAAVLTQDIPRILGWMHRVEVKPGDAFLVPGGLPHAIGAGVFMIEIMEPTDFAARFEFERGGYTLPEAARFMDRGIDFCLDMVDWEPCDMAGLRARCFATPRQRDATWSELIDTQLTDRFRLGVLQISGRATWSPDAATIAVTVAGSGRIRAGDGSHVGLAPGSAFLVRHDAGACDLQADEALRVVIARR